MAPAAIASAASAFGCAVLMPTSSAPPPRLTSTSSQLWASLRLGFADIDSHTRAPAALRPVIAPGLAQCTVTVSPEGSTTSARKRLRRRTGLAGRSEAKKRFAGGFHKKRKAALAPPLRLSSLFSHSLRQRIRAKLEVHRHRLHALAAFDEPGRAVAARRPKPTAL